VAAGAAAEEVVAVAAGEDVVAEYLPAAALAQVNGLPKLINRRSLFLPNLNRRTVTAIHVYLAA
jgi:hypothetical protein